jgi:hypothetical protein
MVAKTEKKATGYDKYVNWKMFIFPVALFFIILMLPTPEGMQDVGTEYQVGPQAVVDHITQRLYGKSGNEVEQWQLLSARIMEQNMLMGALTRDRCLKRSLSWALRQGIPADEIML